MQNEFMGVVEIKRQTSNNIFENSFRKSGSEVRILFIARLH